MNGVVLDVDHLENMDAGGIGQMVERKGKAEDVDELIEPVSRELAGAGFFSYFSMISAPLAASSGAASAVSTAAVFPNQPRKRYPLVVMILASTRLASGRVRKSKISVPLSVKVFMYLFEVIQ